MPDDFLVNAIADLLLQAGQAHHRAFIESDGADPEWPIWYAAYLQAPLNQLLNANLTQSELVYWLVRLDQAYRAAQPARPWPAWYAQTLIAERAKWKA